VFPYLRLHGSFFLVALPVSYRVYTAAAADSRARRRATVATTPTARPCDQAVGRPVPEKVDST